MKKLLLISIAALFVSSSYAQYKGVTTKKENFKHKLAAEEKLTKLRLNPETEMLYFWEQALQDWDLKKVSNYTYTSNDLPDVVIENDANGNPVTRSKYHYNGTLLLGEDVDYWINNAWEPSTKLTIYYDSNKEPIKEEIMVYNGGSWDVVFGFSTYKTFDASTSNETILDSMYTGAIYELVQKRVRHIDQATSLVDTETMYVAVSGSLEPSRKQVIQYDANGLPFLAIQYMWAGIDWEYDRATHEFVWDANERLVSCVNQIWDGFGWVDIQKEENEYLIYDGFRSNVYAIQAGSLINYQRSQYLNDSLYNQIDVKFEEWDGNKWNALMYETSSYTYDQMENILVRIEKTADSLGVLQNNVKQVYTYSGSTGVDYKTNKEIKIYPNPTRDKIWFDSKNSSKDLIGYLFDAQGNELKNFKPVAGQALDISDLANGMYYVKIEDQVYKIMKF